MYVCIHILILIHVFIYLSILLFSPLQKGTPYLQKYQKNLSTKIAHTSETFFEKSQKGKQQTI